MSDIQLLLLKEQYFGGDFPWDGGQSFKSRVQSIATLFVSA